MPRPPKKVAHGKALRTEGSKHFTEDPCEAQSSGEDSRDSEWEVDSEDEGDDGEWTEAHESMRKLYASRLVRHLRTNKLVHDRRVCHFCFRIGNIAFSSIAVIRRGRNKKL